MIAILPTKTQVIVTDTSLEIYTWYLECVNFLMFWINGVPQSQEGVAFIEGELGFKIEGLNEHFFLNSNGDLMINSADASHYAIDEDGMLTRDIGFCGEIL
jgi:hypothetical protein